MAEAGLAPAAHPDNSFLSQAQNIAVYAQNRHNELLAQLRFMGLLCGITGPNDDNDDVENARNAVIEALSDFLSNDNGPLAQQVQKDYDRYLDMRQGLDLYDRFGTAEAINISTVVNSIGSLGHPGDNAPYLSEIAGGSRMPDLATGVSTGRLSPEGAAYVREAHGYYQSAAQKQQQLNEVVAERRRQWWNSVWTNLTSYYDARLAEIQEGRVLEAVTKTAIDAAYVVAEELIYSGMITAIVALTGGAAAAIGVGLRIAISIGSRSARFAARAGSNVIEAAGRQAADTVFNIRITKVEPAPLPGQGQPGNLLHRHRVDVERDLTPDEAKAFGEGGLGSRHPDADAPEQGPSGVSGNKAEQERARGRERNERGKAGEDHYNTQHGGRSLQNDSGNGIDSIKDSDDHITFSEIKTSQANEFRLRGEENLGGPDFVESRLQQMARGQGRYGSLSQADRNYARDLLRRTRAGTPATYQKVKLRENPDGTFTEAGTEPWMRNDGALQRWREQQERQRKRRAERKAAQQPDTTTNPPTGPPPSE